MRKVLGIHEAPRPHWVGDGFPVRSLLSPGTHGQHTSPFLLLDYAGPAEFTATERPRGVGEHPHRGFETVTIVYQASWNIVTRPAMAARSAPAMSSG